MILDDIFLVLAAVPAVAFVLIYLNELRHVRVTPTARHLIGFTAVLALLLLEEIFKRWFAGVISDTLHEAFIAAALIAVTFFLWQRLWLLVIHQVRPRVKAKRSKRLVPRHNKEDR